MISKTLNKNFVIIILVLILSVAIVSAQADRRMFVLNLNYKKGDANPLTLIKISISDGTAPVYHSTIGEGYVVEIINNSGILDRMKFNLPSNALAFNGLSKDVSGTKDDLNFSIYLPFFEQASEIRIYDARTRNLALSIPINNEITKTQQETKINGNNLFPDYRWLYVAGPIALILGMLAYIEVRRKKDHARLMVMQRNNKSGMLKNYVSANLRKGYRKEQIKNALIKNNYNNQEIEEAFKGIR